MMGKMMKVRVMEVPLEGLTEVYYIPGTGLHSLHAYRLS